MSAPQYQHVPDPLDTEFKRKMFYSKNGAIRGYRGMLCRNCRGTRTDFATRNLSTCPPIADMSTPPIKCGEGGIRTRGREKPVTGFRNRPVRPLRHLSGSNSIRTAINCNVFLCVAVRSSRPGLQSSLCLEEKNLFEILGIEESIGKCNCII